MPAILRASCAIPHSESDGLRAFAPDEDGFTLGVAALERLLLTRTRDPPVETVHLVGSFPASVDSGIPELLGHPMTVVRHGTEAASLVAALRAAASEHLGTHAILAVDAPVNEPAPRSGAVAVALLVGSGVGIEIDPRAMAAQVPHQGVVVPGVGTPPTAGPLFALYAAWGGPHAATSSAAPAQAGGIGTLGFRPTGPIEWLGDWAGAPAPALPYDATRRAASGADPLFAVSEGAYVPRPRYLENLPSRWRFVAERCGHCEGLTFPLRGRCRTCHRSDRLERVELPRHGGAVIAATVVARGGQPTEFDHQVEQNGSYGVVLVEMAPGARVTLQVADAPPGSVRIGDRVDTRLRRLYPMEGEWRYGRKAVPGALGVV